MISEDKFFSMYKPNEFIYPDAVQRNFQCTKNEAKNICERRVGKDIRRSNMLECPNCHRHMSVGCYLPRSKEEPEPEWYCPVCDCKLNECNMVIIYNKKT